MCIQCSSFEGIMKKKTFEGIERVLRDAKQYKQMKMNNLVTFY